MKNALMVPRYIKKGLEESQVEAFFERYQMDGLFFYREMLLYLYGPKPKKLPRGKKKGTTKQTNELVRIKVQLYKFLKDKNYSLEELFKIIDKDNSGDIDVNELI